MTYVQVDSARLSFRQTEDLLSSFNDSNEVLNETPWLSFKLPTVFIAEYISRKVDWGFNIGGGNTMGELTFYTRYSRVKDDGTKERWYEVVRRCIEGTFSILKDHCIAQRTPWREFEAQRSAQEAYELMFTMKWTPAGRGLWMMGTRWTHERRNAIALMNCAFISTDSIDVDPVRPFELAMDLLMLGVGVGFDVTGATKISLFEPLDDTWEYVVPDTREGWVEAMALRLGSYLLPGRGRITFDVTHVRPKGEPIKGFGGTASGPEPLLQLLDLIDHQLNGRGGELVRSRDIADLFCMIGKCVVAGNVRRSAEIGLGHPWDDDYVSLKDWTLPANEERMAADGWGNLSNNSVFATPGMPLSDIVRTNIVNGEPGLIYLDLMRSHGRLNDKPQDRDYRVMGVNPCGEQPLEHAEVCNLVETFPTRIKDMREWERVLKFAFMYAKSVTLLQTHIPEVNEVINRNRRIGLSMTGQAQFAHERGLFELINWQDRGYAIVRARDKQYSEWLGVRESIAVTTSKPSGTVALLAGVTPGVHWPVTGGPYTRRMRLRHEDPIVAALTAAGYYSEPDRMDPVHTVVIELPTLGVEMPSEREVSLAEKMSLAAICQRFWSDNSVSATFSFLPGEEAEIEAMIRRYEGHLKSMSFLPLGEKPAYLQMPYEAMPLRTIQARQFTISSLNWDLLYSAGADALGEKYCSNDSCELPAFIPKQ